MISYLSRAKSSDLMGTALLRLDFNTEDDWRMRAVLPTINFLLKTSSWIVIASHKGRPVPGDKKFSLKKNAITLGKFLNRKIIFINDFNFARIRKTIGESPAGSIFLLENLRFDPREEKNDPKFARELASLADFFVNDAFAVSHRANASVAAITKFLPSYAGLELEREIASLSRVMKDPRRPLVFIAGGAKASDKLSVLKYFKNKADWFLLGGGPANTVLALRGMDVKKSVRDKNPKDLAELKKFAQGKDIILPSDFLWHEGAILDVGEKTAATFNEKIAKARTIIWSGPLGLIEKPAYAQASISVARAIARNRRAFSVTGGGETVAFLKKYNLDKKFSFISTGGGAMIDFLAGKKLPGIVALENSIRRVPAKYDIYFHNDFDGRAAAAVVLAFLRSRGDDIEHYIPLKYDVIPQWLDEKFLEKNKLFRGKHNPAIIVDFPYHPQSAFWFDHHLRPFRKPGWEKKFKPDSGHRYDDAYRSACHLAYDSLRHGFGWKPPVHLAELVKWLDVIDFAGYKSAKQTIDMKEPALQANTYIENTSGDFAMTVATIKFLAEKSFSDFVKMPRVAKKIAVLRSEMAQSIRFYEKNIKTFGHIMVVDLTGDPTDDLAHFAPYYLYPKMMYAIRFHPFPGKPWLFHVNVGANPWRRGENEKHIGRLLQKYGGGGHKDVGGVEIEGRAATLRAVKDFVEFLNKK